MSLVGRFCCKSLFALAIKISFGCTDDFHVNMWGTSLSEEKLAGDPGNVIEATSIGGRRSDFFTAGKLAPGNFGLLQQYLPIPELRITATGSRQRTRARVWRTYTLGTSLNFFSYSAIIDFCSSGDALLILSAAALCASSPLLIFSMTCVLALFPIS